MKTIFIFLICGSCLCFCHLNNEQKKIKRQIASLGIDSIHFKTQIQPILEKNCSPCHFPGGKMYEKLPFDRGETIINHQAVIFKRLKKEEDISLIRQYVQQQNKATD
jgi:hypothetical protein